MIHALCCTGVQRSSFDFSCCSVSCVAQQEALWCGSQSPPGCELVEGEPCSTHTHTHTHTHTSKISGGGFNKLLLCQMCLDEAQMVESAATKPAEMCQRLQATHRWCVTGTPVQRDLNGMHSTCCCVAFFLVTQVLTYMTCSLKVSGCFGCVHCLALSFMYIYSVYFCILMFFLFPLHNSWTTHILYKHITSSIGSP